MQNSFGVLDNITVLQILWFSKATRCSDTTKFAVSKTMVSFKSYWPRSLGEI